MFTLLYPGQGSQQPGMGKFLFEQFPYVSSIYEEASDAIKLDLKKLCFEGSVSDLALTENTQPALLTTSIVTHTVLNKEFSVQTLSTAGHSIGEYAAIVASGSLKFSDAVKAVRMRGQAMQAAVPVGQGGMCAVMGLDPDQTDALCSYVVKTSGLSPLSAANYNCPGQIVISGSQKALEWMKENLSGEGLALHAEKIWPGSPTPRLKLIPLQVSAPFHCAMMSPAENKMREVLTDMPFLDAKYPVIQNLDAKAHTQSAELRENLIRQVSAPVKWMQSMNLLLNRGEKLCIEVGTGKVLQGLLKKIDSDSFKVLNTNSIEDLKLIEKTIENNGLT